MNVVVIGGSKRFGKDISDKFRADGHNVFVLSQQVPAETVNHKEASVHSPREAVAKFNELVSTIDHIDLLLWNATGYDGPAAPEDFTSLAASNIDSFIESWGRTTNSGAVTPHLIAITALNKMTDTSRIVFMSSAMGVQFERTDFTHLLSYAGSKAMIMHLATALAHNNDKKALVYSIEPWLPYGQPEHAEVYNSIVSNIYSQLCSFNREHNGKVLPFYN